jgi:hypothetical protein
MSGRLRRVAGAAVPARARTWMVGHRLRRMRARNATRSATEVFSEVYERGRWGLGESFDSGSGSRGETATRYAAAVRALLQQTGARSAVDVGCGDFRVATRFVDDLDSYVGIDVVPDLIIRNIERYGRPGVEFRLLDAAVAEPPDADICFIRQVLQHLSNDQIAAILRRCRKYPTVVVTEHWPAPAAATGPNVDKPHGPDTRLDSGSWVDIAAEPFGCRDLTEILRVDADRPLYSEGETLRTYLWRPNG